MELVAEGVSDWLSTWDVKIRAYEEVCCGVSIFPFSFLVMVLFLTLTLNM